MPRDCARAWGLGLGMEVGDKKVAGEVPSGMQKKGTY